MKKDAKVFIRHILESIGFIEEYVKGKTESDFLDSVPLQDMIIRRIEIIGEATKNVPGNIREKYSDIPWKNIAGMRDILIHEYFGVDLKLAWQTAIKDIPDLKKKLLKIKLK